ncbi:MAG: hypothetical protein GEU90_04540 [Gemmatimonas sp.]|nr:hypothetical protein [Gemmatimonas sp.]
MGSEVGTGSGAVLFLTAGCRETLRVNGRLDSPGYDRVLQLRGHARLQTDADLLASMAVNGKAPTVALVVDIDAAALVPEPVLTAAELWNRDRHIDTDELPRATRMWTDHVKMNEIRGLAAKAIRTGISEKAMRRGSDRDYKQNLY